MQKLKRILALAGAVLLIGMYLITFMLVARVLDNRGHSDSQSKADRQKSLAGSAKDGSAKER